MKKTSVENIKSSLPSFISNLGGYLKTIISLENKKQVIDNASGSIGFLIQLFGKPLIDHYYDKQSENRLKDNGFDTYCKAAFSQVTQTLELIKNSVKEDIPISEAAIGLEKDFFDSLSNLEKNLTILVFQPKYHPAVQMVKSITVEMIGKLLKSESTINAFKKHFNENIEKTVESAFGDDYAAHKSNVEKLWLLEKETKLLIDTINNSKIGFVENEDLKYEEAFGAWQPISIRTPFNDIKENEIEKFEKSLKPVESLIDEYFLVEPDSHIEKVLFVVADFGKGKSVFLKKYAASLATSYLETAEGPIPVYFNLRSFDKYDRADSPLGVIDDYLQTEYAIKISSPNFITKKYIFLIDSLDESCDLTRSAIDKVIHSVQKIQNLERTVYRTNKIVITTRPFDDMLFNIIFHNKPFKIKDEKEKDIANYLALYGFKKEQFNDWIFNTLKTIMYEIDVASSHGFALEIFNALTSGTKKDIYSILLKNRTLSQSELRRPIFAYMIYQLIKNNINITKVGKIGIYLSFLNLLSKEAKYVNDPDLQISLQEQFEARSILHHIAALWLFERQQGKQGSLKKADVCRMVENFGANESDTDVIRQYKLSGGSDIQFLSHSYFGANDDRLHFQHQSFAEMLLAEYYLKVLIKSAFDRPVDIEFVISKLKLGIPTDQTVEFFVELLNLLKETISDTLTPELKEKRKLLVPLLSSIAIHKNNKTLNSAKLFYQWYEVGAINNETNEIPDILLEKWCVDQNMLDSIVSIAEKIISDQKIYLLSKSTQITSLIDKELTQIINPNYENTLFIEKYLALITGNTLFNKNDYFIRRFSTYRVKELLEHANFSWLKKSFRGLSLTLNDNNGMRLNDIITLHNISEFDFTDSKFSGQIFYDCKFFRCNFSNCVFDNAAFYQCYLNNCNFLHSKIIGVFQIADSSFNGHKSIPTIIVEKAFNAAYKTIDDNTENLRRIPRFLNDSNVYIKFRTLESMDEFFTATSFYFNYCLSNQYLNETDIFKAFPSRSEKYNERLKIIIKEINNKGFYVPTRKARKAGGLISS